jgi:CubicO group peptidase (beta-lactamase class C family)
VARRHVTVGLLMVATIGFVGCTDDDDASSATTAPEPTFPPTTPAEAPTTAARPETADSTVPPTTTGGLLDGPVMPVPPMFDEAKVQGAVDQLDDIVGEAMDRTGIPGVAVAVVYQDEVVFAKGYGVRKVGEPATVDPDTVFQVASVSKPVASTIIAGVVGQGKATWTDPVKTWNPDFQFADPYVTDNTDLSDLLSHRTGLPGISGNLLEDLGWDRDYILSVLKLQPLEPFRQTYDYSNFGITEAGVAAADAMSTTWEDLADSMLFQPLGMDSSSYRHADYEASSNKALIHVPLGPLSDKKWEAKYVRNADAEAPAGGLSSSVNDMAKFIRLQLGTGTVDGTDYIDAAALQQTHLPHQEISHPTDPAVRTQFYGLGWNVAFDDQGRVRLDHSGAFLLGTGTNVMMLPGEGLGIVTLTNGQPHGVPEAINNAFFDAATHGRPTVDWLGYFDRAFSGLYAGIEQADAEWATPKANPAPAKALDTYVGTYQNAYYGPLTVQANGDALSMTMGPPAAPTTFALTHFDGDTFTFETIGENATGRSGATFTVGDGATATSVKLEFYDATGLGTFTRS